jgi:hypothetical protein
MYIARAYMNANKPDYKSALATLTAKKKKCDGAASIVNMEMHFMEIKSKFSIFSLP